MLGALPPVPALQKEKVFAALTSDLASARFKHSEHMDPAQRDPAHSEVFGKYRGQRGDLYIKDSRKSRKQTPINVSVLCSDTHIRGFTGTHSEVFLLKDAKTRNLKSGFHDHTG